MSQVDQVTNKPQKMRRSPVITGTKRAAIVQETIRIFECGEHDHPLEDGEMISILEDLQKSYDGNVVIDYSTYYCYFCCFKPKVILE